MTAVRNYSKSDLVGSFKPFVQHLSSDFKDTCCNHCFSKKATLKRCAGCYWVSYCDSVCQKRSWKWHRFECSLVRRAISRNPVSPTIPSNSVLFLYKLYSYSKSSKAKEVKDEIVGVVRSYDSLMSHAEEIKLDADRMAKFYDAYVQLKIFTRLADENHDSANDTRGSSPAYECRNDCGTFDEALLLETFGKMLINSYSILDEDLNDVGTGLYLGPSLLDHSCQGNCVCVFNGTTLKLKCVANVKANEKLSISYIDPMDTTQHRSTELLHCYYFLCQCVCCRDVSRDREMEEVVIENDDEYNSVEKEEEKERLRMRLDEDFKQFNIKAKDKDYEDLYLLAAEFKNKWEGKVSAKNIRFFHVLLHHYECCVVLKKWSEALVLGDRITGTYEYYISSPLPNYVFHLVKLAKIYLYIHENIKALQILEKVQPMVATLYDPQDVLSHRHDQLLSQCLSELSLH